MFHKVKCRGNYNIYSGNCFSFKGSSFQQYYCECNSDTEVKSSGLKLVQGRTN